MYMNEWQYYLWNVGMVLIPLCVAGLAIVIARLGWVLWQIGRLQKRV